MPGRIPDRDIAAIREQVRIEDLVGEYVALKRAGADSMKGLCPFHEEKSPSFHVRPNHGLFHCFGCSEGGDVYAFLQKIEHIGFVEAVEHLAERVGHHIDYQGGGTSVQRDRGTRARLVAANSAAHEFYQQRLGDPEAQAARDYLTARDFDAAAARHFGCGFAPAGWDTLTKHLISRGFEFKELEAAGLSRQGRRGPIDRFHRRLLWPIRNVTGEVIGFGARKLFDDDTLPGKYVNTPETVLYKKSQVLFGLDLAKRDIAKAHQAVVVEGYTDVMAMHLAGVKTAVAACGTAFGDGHFEVLRRLLLDDNFWKGEIIFTFDGDLAGQAAARKAFTSDHKVAGKTFVVVTPEGMDPCELRQQRGDTALRELVARRQPLFDYALRRQITELEDSDGSLSEASQVELLKWGVPIVAQLRDHAERKRYATKLADWTGWHDPDMVHRRVGEESRRIRKAEKTSKNTARPGKQPTASHPNPRDPELLPQRQALAAGLQYPALAGPAFDELDTEAFTHPDYQAVRELLRKAGGTTAGLSGASWLDAVTATTDDPALQTLVRELASEQLPISSTEVAARFVTGIIARVSESLIGRQIAQLKSRLHRMPADDANYPGLFGDLVALEQYRKSLLEQAMGS